MVIGNRRTAQRESDLFDHDHIYNKILGRINKAKPATEQCYSSLCQNSRKKVYFKDIFSHRRNPVKCLAREFCYWIPIKARAKNQSPSRILL